MIVMIKVRIPLIIGMTITLLTPLSFSTSSPESDFEKLRKVLIYGEIEKLEGLIADGFDVNARLDETGETILMRACRSGRRFGVRIIRLLVESGARVNDADKDGNSALICVASTDALYPMDLLVNVVDEKMEKVRFLLVKGATVDWKNREGKTALMALVSADGDNLAIAKLLVAHGADINAEDSNGVSVLMYACRRSPRKVKFLEMFKFLLGKGANIDHKDNLGRTVLMYASARRDYYYQTFVDQFGNFKDYHRFDQGHDFMRFLVDEMRSGVNYGDQRGRTALMYASRADNLTMVKRLLESGAEIGAKDHGGRTALAYVIDGDHSRILKYLVEKGLDITEPIDEKTGATSLMLAAARGSKYCTRFLHERAPELINMRDNNGSTALLYAFIAFRYSSL